MAKGTIDKRYQFSDISNAPLKKGDIIVVFEERKEAQYTFKITNILDLPDGTGRALSVVLIKTTDPEFKPGQEYDIKVLYSEPMLGAVVPASTDFDELDALEQANFVAAQLYQWLMSRIEHNFGAKVADSITFVDTLNMFPDDVVSTQQKKDRLMAIIKQHRELFKSKGGFIFATGKENVACALGGAGSSVKTIPHVSMKKLTAGLRLILESGILGTVIIDE